MRYYQLNEKRKNPELNPKYDIRDELIRLLNKSRNTLYVSFTDLKKLGLNPVNQHPSPTGIYCYSLHYVVDMINKRGSTTAVTYAGERDNVWVFELEGDGLYTFNYSKSQESRDINLLDEYCEANDLDPDACRNSCTGFERISTALYEIGEEINSMGKAGNNFTAFLLYKILGYDFVVDNTGFFDLHSSEQCCVFNYKSIKNKILLRNSKDNINRVIEK